MNVKDLGELGLIEYLTDLITQRTGGQPESLGHSLIIDISDDAMAWTNPITTSLATTDTIVEGVHFTKNTSNWGDLGWKVITANLSDIASMGGLPIYALITLGIPNETKLEDLELLYKSILDMAEEYKFKVVGGDIVKSPYVFITVSLIGATDSYPMNRASAKFGDQIGITGFLGSSLAGLKMISGKIKADMDNSFKFKEAHLRPRPHLIQGRILSDAGVVSAMDISDGLVTDLSKLCKSSRVSAHIKAHQLPIDPLLKNLFPEEYIQMGLVGGEDYPILFTAPPEIMRSVLPKLPFPASTIGEILDGTPGNVIITDKTGKDITPPNGGWDHFS
jgi:thiamine-monophosphate kinase